MSSRPCNGWANRATWIVNLWLANDERLTTRAAELVAVAKDVCELADQFHELVQEEILNHVAPGNLAFELLAEALDDVAWDELAIAWLEG